MSAPDTFDLCVIGAGIVGLATARALTRAKGPTLVVLEAENRPAVHQTGHNSGVIHSGLYDRPGSHKAKLCATGREALMRYVAERGIAHERCGKIVVATSEREVAALEELERRGRANGLTGITRLGPEGIREHEPQVRGLAGLHVAETGIVDFKAVTLAYAEDVQAAGGELRLSTPAGAIRREGDHFHITTPAGEVRARYLINCGGLQADRIARRAGVTPTARIVPFRGEYAVLRPEKRSLVKNLIYPVPDPRFPFLGVHFTRGVDGEVEAGPNAVLALKREGYRRSSFSLRDSWETLSYPGFWHLARRFWRVGAREYYRSFRKAVMVQDLRRLLPALQGADLQQGGSGVRAQAVAADGRLLDDFHFLEAESMIHVLNAPSPAATASLAIGATVADRARDLFALP
jgi:L-2-hydroxyglutarate oxidase